MAYIDTHILESELAGTTKHDFDVVALAGMGGSVGALVTNQFGVATDMDELATRVRRPFTRLLVGVEDPRDPATVERVRAQLRFPDYPPF
ncbi:hypothetical protein [Roseateles sp. P5_E7]